MNVRSPMVYDSALHMMEEQGGSFVKSLAACYYAADPTNRRRLLAAFADWFDQYERRFKDHCARMDIKREADACDAEDAAEGSES